MQKISWNARIACTKLQEKKKIRKLFEKNLDQFVKKNHFKVSSETPSSISLPNFEAVGHR